MRCSIFTRYKSWRLIKRQFIQQIVIECVMCIHARKLAVVDFVVNWYCVFILKWYEVLLNRWSVKRFKINSSDTDDHWADCVCMRELRKYIFAVEFNSGQNEIWKQRRTQRNIICLVIRQFAWLPVYSYTIWFRLETSGKLIGLRIFCLVDLFFFGL